MCCALTKSYCSQTHFYCLLDSLNGCAEMLTKDIRCTCRWTKKKKNWWRKGKHTWDLLVHKTSSYHVIDQFQWMFRERNYFRFFWTIVSDVSLAVAFRRKNDVNVHIKCVLSLTFCINQFTVHNQILRKRKQKTYKFFSRLMGARVRPELLFYVVSIIPLCIVHHISRCYTFSLFSGWPMMCHWMRLIRAIIHTK